MIRRAIETIKTAEAIKTIEVIKRITVKQITKRCLPVLMAAAVLLPGMMEMTAGTCLEAFAQEVERIGPGGQTANVQEVKTQTAGNQVNPVPSNQISAKMPRQSRFSQVGHLVLQQAVPLVPRLAPAANCANPATLHHHKAPEHHLY